VDRVSNESLLEAGLSLMAQARQPLEKVSTGTRAMMFKKKNGETVRVRTCNDHVLVVVADSPKPTAKLNIEGTDSLLIVMPESPRVSGPVIAYLVPTAIAVKDVRKAHAEWLASSPKTKGGNRTWNIWFGESDKSGGFARHWASYRLAGYASTLQNAAAAKPPHVTSPSGKLGAVIADAKRSIAEAAGVPIEAVKISVELH